MKVAGSEESTRLFKENHLVSEEKTSKQSNNNNIENPHEKIVRRSTVERAYLT